MKHRLWTMPAAALLIVLWVAPAAADIANFDLAGRIYTKWLYRNNDSQGLLSYGNPFWPDDIAGDNGVGTEFELKIFGTVSKYVQGYARIQSRFGEIWQDWWESGTVKQEYDGEENTSGDSLGMNRASYMKLRGTYIRAAIPIPTLDWVTVGSSDLGMFNPWTIGKIRYIDRDNGKGVFLDGHVGEGIFSYSLAMIALPKLWVGPWWSTGIGDPSLSYPFYSQDWAYGAKFTVTPSFGTITLVSTLTNDVEIDNTDPDAVGSLYASCTDDLGNPIIGCSKDNAVDYYSRYLSSNTTIEGQFEPLDFLSLNVLGAFSLGRIDSKLTANGVEDNQGVSPVVYKDTNSYAIKVRADIADPFDVGLSFKAEYFNIGEDYNAIFGARREADVLLTDGFLEGGQLPTLNLANEFIDFDEAFVESCIGWHGGTLLTQYATGPFDAVLETSVITYNQNTQGRDVDRVYPDFLHSDGYTDTDVYDYANASDRGRDPRSVYRRNQDRLTVIGMLGARYQIDVGGGLELSFKGKYIRDVDNRRKPATDQEAWDPAHPANNDNYVGNLYMGRIKATYGLADGLLIEAGGQFDYWQEDRRKGTLEQGYGNDVTHKEKAFAGLTYEFEGLKLRYHLEFLHKDQDRERDTDQNWVVFRSKASLEVNW